MADTAADDLAVLVQRTLRDTSEPLWMPGLTPNLADAAWDKLGDDIRLTRASYGTARVLRRDPAEARLVVACLDGPSRDVARRASIPIELLPDDLARRLAGSDIRFFGADEVLHDGVLEQVEEALGFLGEVITLLPTVCSLVSALHLIDARDDEVDISFSEPCLPFSAFVSVPGPGSVAGALRVAEALLHEAMHLQLTLIESQVPLVKPALKTYFSPWRKEYRSPQGVLHALYVFRVIDEFLNALDSRLTDGQTLQGYARERRASIAGQVLEVLGFRECVDLTENGAALVSRLFE